MPTRILRDGIVDSKAVNSLSDSGEIFYRRLMSVVDDYGRFELDETVLRARLFARVLDRWPLSRVSKALSEVSHVTADGDKLVTAYTVNNKKYLQINNFGQRTRACKYPGPEHSDGEVRSYDGGLPTNDGELRSSARLVGVGVGGEGEGEDKTLCPPAAGESGDGLQILSEAVKAEQLERRVSERRNSHQSRFDEFWGAWPVGNKVDKAGAIKAWKAKVKPEEADLVIERARQRGPGIMQRAAAQGSTPIYPSTWLYNRRWEDEEQTALVLAPRPQQKTKSERVMEKFDELMAYNLERRNAS